MGTHRTAQQERKQNCTEAAADVGVGNNKRMRSDVRRLPRGRINDMSKREEKERDIKLSRNLSDAHGLGVSEQTKIWPYILACLVIHKTKFPSVATLARDIFLC